MSVPSSPSAPISISLDTHPPAYRTLSPVSPSTSRHHIFTTSPLDSSSSRRQQSLPPDWPVDPSQPTASSSRMYSGRVSTSPPSNSTVSTPDPSTAPTTPQLGAFDIPSTSRSWRPTPNVPSVLARRHAVPQHLPGSEDGNRNRWLSDDEGASGGSSIGRRRRRRQDSGDNAVSRAGTGLDRPRSRERRANSINMEEKLDVAGPSAGSKPVGQPAKPRTRRVSSFDDVSPAVASSSRHAIPLSDVGAQPPRIQDLVSGPLSPNRATAGLSIAAIVSQDTSGSSTPGTVLTSEDKPPDPVPDRALSQGGDGIEGTHSDSSTPSTVDAREAEQKRKDRRELIEALRRILGCALCPASPDGQPPLHHPITLPCGHTLSSDHVTISFPASVIPASTQPHDIFAAQQRQHQQRLSLWAGVMCPIPTCKRYSPRQVSGTGDVAELPVVDAPLSEVVSTSRQRAEMLGSGVAYYPPQQSAPPAYTAETSIHSDTSHFLDVTVEKVKVLVLREMGLDVGPALRGLREAVRMDEEDPDMPQSRHSPFSQDLLRLEPVQPDPLGSPRIEPETKRRRNHLHSPRSRSRTPSSSAASVYDWPFKKDLMATLECDVCAMLLYEPVTTPCQHSFCSKCLSRSLDHSSRCPVCRQDLPSFAFFQDHAVNKVLLSISKLVKTAFPDEYIERQHAIERDEGDAQLDTPIFCCTLAFPGMPTILHVFEPRYRLMIRRCIESSSPRFGMVLPARGSSAPGLQGVSEYGTMLEIQSVQMLPDGRSMVETVGVHRFKLLEKGSLDGYSIGRIERIDDISPEEELSLEREAVARAASGSVRPATPQQAMETDPAPGPDPTGPGGMAIPTVPGAPGTTSDDIVHTTEEYMGICRAFIDQLRGGSAPWLLQRLNETYGIMPEDPSEFSYWMALVMPIDEFEKARLLPIRSPRLRLKLIVHWVESLRSSWWFSSG